MCLYAICASVSASIGQVQVFFVFQGLASGTISNAVLMKLVELKRSFQHRDQNTQASRGRGRKVKT